MDWLAIIGGDVLIGVAAFVLGSQYGARDRGPSQDCELCAAGRFAECADARKVMEIGE